MKNRLIKIIGYLSLTIMIITTTIPVFAITPSLITSENYNSTPSLKSVSGNILGAVQIIGTTISVILFISSIIRYFCVVPEKRNKKKTIICIVCAIILFYCSNMFGGIQGPCCVWFE